MCWSSHHHYRYQDRRRPAPRSVSDPVAVPGNTRVSDTERNRVIELLKQHTADGRLTLEEFAARVDEALEARTGSDLRKVLRDLPVPDRERPGPRSLLPVAGSMLRLPVIALVVVLIWVAVGHLLLWPLFVVAFFWFRIGGGHHASPLGLRPARAHRDRGHHDVRLVPEKPSQSVLPSPRLGAVIPPLAPSAPGRSGHACAYWRRLSPRRSSPQVGGEARG